MTYIDGSTATPAALSAGMNPTGMATLEPTITAAEVKARWERGQKPLKQLIGHYRENVSFDAGDQWFLWNRQTNQLQEIPRKDERVRATANRIKPARRIVMAKLHRRPLVFEVIPTAPDDATVRSARIAEAVLSHCAREQRWEEVRATADLSAWLGGTAILTAEWNPAAGKILGQLDDGRPYGTGETVVASRSIAQIAVPPGTLDARTAQWCVTAAIMPVADAKDRYRMANEPSADASSATYVNVRTSSTDASGTPEKSCLVLTYYERPSGTKPGQVATVIGGEIVAGPYGWPYPFTDHLPIAVIRESPIEDHWAGMTVVSDAIQLQTLLNLSLSGISEHVKLAGNARLVISERAMELIDSLSDLPGEIIPLDPSDGVEPKWISPPALPNWLVEETVNLARQMDDILGTQDVSRGSTPENIQSGLGLSILAEQADTPLTAMASAAARAWGYIASDVLACYEKYATEPRTARVDTPGQRSEEVTWTGQDISGQTTATVPLEAVTPRSRAAMQALAVRLWELKIVQDPKIIAMIGDFPDQAALLEAVDPDTAKAERENHDMTVGRPAVPADFDDHQKHIAEHNRFRKSSRYEQMPQEQRTMIDNHVLAHENIARAEAARQALAPPPMSGVPQADQPVGSAGGPPTPGGFQVPAPGAPGELGAETFPEGTPPSEPLGQAAQTEMNPTAPPPNPAEVLR